MVFTLTMKSDWFKITCWIDWQSN